jgi:hypothetical protein
VWYRRGTERTTGTGREWTLTELARRVRGPVSSAQREVDELSAGWIARLVTDDWLSRRRNE